jgi:antitoxin component YwqK of YwqJK toxin-antitoxin module
VSDKCITTDNNKYDAKGKLKNGPVKAYFKDGGLCSVGKYANGDKTGEWKYYLVN